MIKFDKLTKDFKTGNIKVRALDEVSFELPNKGFVCILGQSGCGKSTLLNILGGLDIETKGEFLINGNSTKTFSDKDWDSYRNQYIGFIFQNYYLVPHLSIKENIALACKISGVSKEIRDKKLDDVIKKVGLNDIKDKRVTYLSGGQMQRVAIARAIINEPKIILADEPTGALDSKTAKIVMDILKDISKDRLVVMVTHNEDLANKYGTRIINMLDGKIIKDSDNIKIEKVLENLNFKKVKIPFYTTFYISLKNLIEKRLRTLLLIIAVSIGTMGVGLVLSLSKGVEIFLDNAQANSIGSYPITVYSEAIVEQYENPIKTLYPTDNNIRVRYAESRTTSFNYIEEEFLNYLDKLDKSSYTVINRSVSIQFRTISKLSDNTYQTVSSSWSEVFDNEEFMLKQYDVLTGHLPKSANEVVLLVDSYNAIHASTLVTLGLLKNGETKDKVSFTFDELIGKEYKIINNNDWYIPYEGRYYTDVSQGNLSSLYNNSNDSLEIVGIIRSKEDATLSLYNTGLLYSPLLTEKIYSDALNSNIVKDQIHYGYEKDVLTGSPIIDYITDTSFTAKEYYYDYRLYSLGAIKRTNSIKIYTSSFELRYLILDYLELYESNRIDSFIRYSDYFKDMSKELASLMDVVNIALIIFTGIALSISIIMISIVTYISVIERIKEIGLLRSLGGKKKDIAFLFIAETSIIGLLSGIIGVIGTLIISNPINEYCVEAFKKYGYSFLKNGSTKVARFEPYYIIILIVFSIIFTIIAGLIPSIMAARKKPIEALKTE